MSLVGLLGLCLLGVPGLWAVPAIASDLAPLKITLDPGHNPDQQGALGARGIYEVVYNDHLTAKIAAALRTAGYDVTMTRQPTQKITLDKRAEIANNSRADLFLAIHHDSAQSQFLEKTTYGDHTAYRSTRPLAGYSLFVSKKNPQFDKSYIFAQLLGEEVLKLGRSPSPHHAENIAGEDRVFLDPHLGIYQFDDLIVLKKTRAPAALLEVGVIVDPDDENYVSDPGKQDAITQAIVTAVRRYDGMRRRGFSQEQE